MVHHRLDRPRPWKRLLSEPEGARRLHVLTDDGQRIVLRHLAPEKRNGHPPVMLLHGLGANHQTWQFEGRSFARWLADRGHDVWIPELRGHGASTRREYDWHFDHYLLYDLPAIIEAIGEQSGAEKIQWVGHSMGGVLLYCYAIMHDDPPLERGLAIASALDYGVGSSGFKPLLKLRPVLEKVGSVPWGTFTHLVSPVLGRGLALENFNVWPTNIEPSVARRLHARVFHSIPVSLLSSLATTFEDDGFRLQNGFKFVPRADTLNVPLLLLAGSKDQQVSVDAVKHTAGLIGENALVRVFGKAFGEADEYGHFDLILGKRAEAEVWPAVSAWLEGEG